MRNPEISEESDYIAWEDDSPGETIATFAADPIALIVETPAAGIRLDKWLAQRLDTYSRVRIRQWIEGGHVLVNGSAGSAKAPVWSGDEVIVTPQAADEEMAYLPEPMEFDIRYEDASILVVNKPAGLVVHPAVGNWGGTLLNGLLHYLPGLSQVPRAGIVHRLDKETSGLMVVAKSMVAQTNLIRQLQARSMRREYLALVWGSPPTTARIDLPIGRHPRERTRMAVLEADAVGAKVAVTHIEVVARGVFDAPRAMPVSLCCCRLETGRTHQIRVHLQELGYPLVGEPVYCRNGMPKSIGRQALHAWRLGLLDPIDNTPRAFSAAPPDDMQALISACGISLEPTQAAAVP